MADLKADLQALLSWKLPTTFEEQKDALEALELLRQPLLAARVEAQKVYFLKREQYRHPKDKDLNDFDRQTMLNAATVEEQAELETLKGLEELVRDRVEIIKLLIGEINVKSR